MTAFRIVQPTTPPAYASLDVFKAQIGVTDDSQDAVLLTHLQTASAMVDAYVNYPLAAAEWSETFRTHNVCRRTAHLASRIYLTRKPVLNISSIMVDQQTVMVDVLDVDVGAAVIYLPDHMMSARRITVVYRAGYALPGDIDAPPLPPVVTAAVLTLARGIFFSPARGDPGVRSQTAQGVGSVSYLDPTAGTGGMPQDVADSLDPFVMLAV